MTNPPQRSEDDRPHLVKRSLEEEVYYPAHSPRTESPEYRAVHHRLVVVEDHPCIVCGVRNSTLKDPTHNLIGARAIETHHHDCEWSLMDAVDVGKFNARIVHHYRARRPADPKYDHEFTEEEMKAWIDHDPDNLWVICDKHHRGRLVGIHDVTGPIWGPQDLLRSDFIYTPPGGAPST